MYNLFGKWDLFNSNASLFQKVSKLQLTCNKRSVVKRERERKEHTARRLILTAAITSERNLAFEPLEADGTGQREREKPWNVTGRILWLSYLWHASALSEKNAAPGINNRRWWNSFCRESPGTLIHSDVLPGFIAGRLASVESQHLSAITKSTTLIANF